MQVKSMALEGGQEGAQSTVLSLQSSCWLSPESCPAPRFLPLSCPQCLVSETILNTEQCPKESGG